MPSKKYTIKTQLGRVYTCYTKRQCDIYEQLLTEIGLAFETTITDLN